MTLAQPGSEGQVPPQPAQPLEPHRGTMILVFGILGIVLGFCCVGVVFGILAWVFAAGDLKKMDRGIMNPEGRGSTNAGLIMGIISVVLVSLLLIIGLVRGVSGDKSFGFLDNASRPDKSSVARPLPETPKIEEQATGEEKTFAVGEVATLKNHAISVYKVERGYQSGNQFIRPKSSANEYVVVGVGIVNTSDEDLPVNQFGFELEDENGIKRNPDLFINVSPSLESVTLAPKGKISGFIGFEAPKGSKVLKLHYRGNMFSGKEIVFDLLKK